MEPNKELDPERKFKSWLYWLKRAAVLWLKFKNTTTFSPEHWKVYYDEGLNVFEALREDFKHA